MTRLAMLSSCGLASLALVAGFAAAPALAQQDQTQSQMQNRQQQIQQGESQRVSQEGRACLDRLEGLDQRLAGLGYGQPGPRGYGVYGTAYRPMTPTATDGTSTALTRPLRTTPRADMYALMRAGFVMAQTGYDQGCQQVAAAVEDMAKRYETAMRSGDVDRAGMAQWRETFLSDATKVTELDQPLRAGEIIGGDLRNMRDEDLGDIEDVVIGANGEIQYVIVSTGGFLGLGEEEVPVPWSDLRVTAAPYRDTFVLDVSDEAFSDAPRVNDGLRSQLATGKRSDEVDGFWDEALGDPS